MDAQGIDVQALSINPFWYTAERDVAAAVVKIQNEKLAGFCAAHKERFVAFATVALRHPDLAVEQLVYGVKSLGLRGISVGGSVNGEELAAEKFHPVWAKAEELGVLVFLHPQGTPELEAGTRLKGNGGLDNLIGNPLETTIALTHLIFEGTLDRFPRLKLCAAHGGGYLLSYAARSDAIGVTFPQRVKPLKKRPTEYLKQLYYDSIVFTPGGAASPRCRDRLRPDRDGHRLSLSLDQHIGRPHPHGARFQRCRARGDARRHGVKIAGDRLTADVEGRSTAFSGDLPSPHIGYSRRPPPQRCSACEHRGLRPAIIFVSLEKLLLPERIELSSPLPRGRG